MAQQRIVIVGGGVMGLAAGCALAAQPDIEVTVLERFQVGTRLGLVARPDPRHPPRVWR